MQNTTIKTKNLGEEEGPSITFENPLLSEKENETKVCDKPSKSFKIKSKSKKHKKYDSSSSDSESINDNDDSDFSESSSDSNISKHGKYRKKHKPHHNI